MADSITIECELGAETVLAILVFEGKKEVWVPKKLIKQQVFDEEGFGTITVSLKNAIKLNLL